MTKIARIVTSGRLQWAALHREELLGLPDLPGAESAEPQALLSLVRDGIPARMLQEAPRLDPEAVTWLPPVTRPGKIICLGLNYAAHAAEGGNSQPEYPSFFMRGASSLIGHQAPLVRPKVSDKLDFEAELAVVIGRRARHLTAADALTAVAGYSCFNDGTLRDYQRRTAQWTIGKNFDGTGAFGPYLVAASELPDGARGLRIESRLNGQVMQSDNTANMIVPVAEALQLLTEVLTLEPGDVVVMGTPAGVGYARTPAVWMQPGDRIDIEIEGVGQLSNPITQEA
ncbi:fumarylacetoacetate hydrolase family protein [Diaphorobacter sp. JS3051]|uniref:fumarylacetoacetate hydrolase family protein n=1 Tax=Diaphorobacter sp. JS3051 TaxID=2792224 RepID=UPI0018CA348C|nr:fumarylacetoacetate hydrolase family protein [Diaphorobacter sp. JS3051]QPN32329.1 fumarylacetoacetate hydrolase family protein [Diaphorobacter sp. JS3051]